MRLTNKSLVRLIRNKKTKLQISQMRGTITEDSTDIYKTIKKYEQLYVNNIDYLDEMDKFFKRKNN